MIPGTVEVDRLRGQSDRSGPSDVGSIPQCRHAPVPFGSRVFGLADDAITCRSMQRKPIVLALGNGFVTDEGKKLYEHLKSLADLHWYHSPLKDETWPSTLARFVKEQGAPRVLLLYGASVGRVGSDLLSSLVPGLRLVASQGAGYDNVDLEYCTKNKIWVANTPDSVTDSTANCAVWFILSILRDFTLALETAKSGSYREGLGLSRDPSGLKLGIVGLGRIGANVARKMNALGMEIFYHSRHRASKDMEKEGGNATYVTDLKELVSTCDVISVHVPLSAGTEHLFDAAVFAEFKGGIFVNTARGKIHDETALISALENGSVSKAGLDVFEDEPNIPEQFTKYGSLADKVVTTPHIGAFTKQAQVQWEIEMLENVIGVIEHDKPKHPVNDPSQES